MPLSVDAVQALATRCAPTVAAGTVLAIARVESGLEPLAIGVNGPTPRRLFPTSTAAATQEAEALVQAGHNVDLGLLQINSRTLASLGLPISAAFDPCQNVKAGGRVLQADYERSGPDWRGPQAALRVALSYYNTGGPSRGFQNGYVARVTGDPRPLASAGRADGPSEPPPPWTVFAGRPSTPPFVISPGREGASQ